jgi:mannose-6-phosphate isomerase class I
MDRRAPLRLECGIQHYEWGQRGEQAFIPQLLGAAAEQGTPYAELWIGAHPGKPSCAVVDGRREPLDALIERSPESVLGRACLERFGPRLPFLMKVLAAERMLSLQAHPNEEQAREGFAREEARGLPRDAPHRSYKDDSHKPELIVALTAFRALCGFRPAAEAAADFARQPELSPILAAAGGDRATVESLYAAVVAAPDTTIDPALGALLARLEAEDRGRPFAADRHEHWILRAARQLMPSGRPDRGLVTVWLLHLVALQPGEGLFLPAGELHSYLEGVGIEVMASSDNVLRGGLTPKHVDAAELQRILTFRAATPRALKPNDAGVYETSAAEFELSIVDVTQGSAWRPPLGSSGPEILLAVEGAGVVAAPDGEVTLGRGEAVLVPASVGGYAVSAVTAAARLFRCAVPAPPPPR